MDLNTWSSVTGAVWEADKTLGCRIFVEEVCHWCGPLLPSCSLSALCCEEFCYTIYLINLSGHSAQ